MDAGRRQDLVECLLGILVEFIPFELPDETRAALLEEPTGSWVIPCTTSITTADNNIVWKQPSLYWMWQEETGSCCLNFLAQEGFFQWGTIEAFQWTLEASYDNSQANTTVHGSASNYLHGGSQTEFRRFEPMVLASDDQHGVQASPPSSTMTPIRSFWKIASLKSLCVEFPVATLMGALVKDSSSTIWRLEPLAVFECGKVALIGKLPSTSTEHIQVAKIIGLLEAWKTPQVLWSSPPGLGIHESFSVDSLADIFRRAFTFLEDEERSRPTSTSGTAGGMAASSKSASQRTSNNESNSETTAGSPTHRRIDIKKSISDSLVMTGGLAATGASFVTPIGAAVSVAAIGVKDGVAAAARKGQDSRNGEGYKFGDVTRGIVTSIKDRKSQRQARAQQQTDDLIFTGEETPSANSRDDEHSFLEINKSRYVGVVGSSVGAAVGLTLVGGPLGLLAGSLAGGAATQEAIRRQSDTYVLHMSPDEEEAAAVASSNRRSASAARLSTHNTDEEIIQQLEREDPQKKKPWKFGDNIRNVVQKGKEAAGRDADAGYKPGDFSRGLGLFSRKK